MESTFCLRVNCLKSGEKKPIYSDDHKVGFVKEKYLRLMVAVENLPDVLVVERFPEEAVM